MSIDIWCIVQIILRKNTKKSDGGISKIDIKSVKLSKLDKRNVLNVSFFVILKMGDVMEQLDDSYSRLGDVSLNGRTYTFVCHETEFTYLQKIGPNQYQKPDIEEIKSLNDGTMYAEQFLLTHVGKIAKKSLNSNRDSTNLSSAKDIYEKMVPILIVGISDNERIKKIATTEYLDFTHSNQFKNDVQLMISEFNHYVRAQGTKSKEPDTNGIRGSVIGNGIVVNRSQLAGGNNVIGNGTGMNGTARKRSEKKVHRSNNGVSVNYNGISGQVIGSGNKINGKPVGTPIAPKTNTPSKQNEKTRKMKLNRSRQFTGSLLKTRPAFIASAKASRKDSVVGSIQNEGNLIIGNAIGVTMNYAENQGSSIESNPEWGTYYDGNMGNFVAACNYIDSRIDDVIAGKVSEEEVIKNAMKKYSITDTYQDRLKQYLDGSIDHARNMGMQEQSLQKGHQYVLKPNKSDMMGYTTPVLLGLLVGLTLLAAPMVALLFQA